MLSLSICVICIVHIYTHMCLHFKCVSIFVIQGKILLKQNTNACLCICYIYTIYIYTYTYIYNFKVYKSLIKIVLFDLFKIYEKYIFITSFYRREKCLRQVRVSTFVKLQTVLRDQSDSLQRLFMYLEIIANMNMIPGKWL